MSLTVTGRGDTTPGCLEDTARNPAEERSARWENGGGLLLGHGLRVSAGLGNVSTLALKSDHVFV